jgi:hypothetical protein
MRSNWGTDRHGIFLQRFDNPTKVGNLEAEGENNNSSFLLSAGDARSRAVHHFQPQIPIVKMSTWSKQEVDQLGGGCLTNNTLDRCERQLFELTRRRAVALTFSDTIPPGLARESAAHPSGCTFWKLASEGRSFYTEAVDHFGCAGGA